MPWHLDRLQSGGLMGLINRLNATTSPCKTDGTRDPPRKQFSALTANNHPTLTIIGNHDG